MYLKWALSCVSIADNQNRTTSSESFNRRTLKNMFVGLSTETRSQTVRHGLHVRCSFLLYEERLIIIKHSFICPWHILIQIELRPWCAMCNVYIRIWNRWQDFCEHGIEPSGFIKCWEISWLVEELLAYHDIPDWEGPQEYAPGWWRKVVRLSGGCTADVTSWLWSSRGAE